jgi:hypothetical protein
MTIIDKLWPNFFVMYDITCFEIQNELLGKYVML